MNEAATVCEERGYTLVDMRFVKPIDEALITDMAEQHELLVTIEENSLQGGAGSAVSEHLHAQNIVMPLLQLGLPDSFVDHGKHQQMLADCGLDAKGIGLAISEKLKAVNDPAKEKRASGARLGSIGSLELH